MSKNKYIIVDWANNLLFGGETFSTFEDAWGFIFEKSSNEEDFDDYYVINEKDYA